MTRSFILSVLLLIVIHSGCRPQPVATSATLKAAPRPPRLDNVQVVFLLSPQRLPEVPPLVTALGQQAILLALREELGLTTRDQSLGDEVPTPLDQSVALLQLHVDGNCQQGWTFAARLHGNSSGTTVCQLRVDVPPVADAEPFYPQLVARLEAAARGELVQQLKASGLQGQPRPPRGQTPLGTREREDQESAHVLRQWRAVRVAHAALVVAGPSPDLVAALARGYARLAWMHPEQREILAARALLYARRLQSLDGDTEQQQRCWCEALVAAGLHDVAAAALAAGKFTDAAAAALQLVCRFEVEPLAELWKKTGDPAIGNLWVLSLRTTPNLTLQRQRAAAEVLEREPGALHLAEGRGLAPVDADLARQLREWLPRFNDLPMLARQALEQPQGLKQLLGNLIELGRQPTDRFEPSWTVLARRIQDLILQEALTAAAKRLPDADDELASYLDGRAALLRGHPGLPHLHAIQALLSAGKGRAIHQPPPPIPPDDPLTFAQPTPLRLRGLLRQSSHHPVVLAQLLLEDQEHRARWQAEAENWGRAHVVVLEALARCARQRGDGEAECAALKQRVALSADRDACEQLAQLYLQRGQVADWQATLEACLEQQTELRDRAELLVLLAREWLRRGVPSRAMPFALQAAQTGQAVGLLCGIDCLTAAGRLGEAEQMAKRYVRRRQNEPQVWLFWCLRTGHGDLPAAWRHVDDYLAGVGEQGNRFDWELRGVVALLREQPALAGSAFQAAWLQGQQPYALQHLALVRLERGESLDPLAAMAKQLPADEVESARARQFLDWLTTTPPERALEALRCLEPPARANQGYFLGRLFELRGQPDRAVTCYRLSVDAQEPWLWNSLLAQVRLRRLSP